MTTHPEISVLIPAFNEEGGIGDVLERIKKTLTGFCQYEVIVIDDGSTDRTAEIARAAGATVIVNPVNIGYGFSLKRGFRAARYECVVMTDGDGTYPIEEIPGLVAHYERGVDMVVGARQGMHYWSSWMKGAARLVFKTMSEFVVGRRIPDINSGLRVVRRSKILPFLTDLSNAFSFTTSMTLVFFLQHFFVTYVPIAYHERRGTSKVHYVRDTLRTLQIMVDIIAAYNPLKLFLLISFVPLLGALGFLILATGTQHQGWLLYSLVSFLFTILIFSLGCIATVFRKKMVLSE